MTDDLLYGLLLTHLASPWVCVVVIVAMDFMGRRERPSWWYGLPLLLTGSAVLWTLVPPAHGAWVLGAQLRSLLWWSTGVSLTLAIGLAAGRALRPGAPSARIPLPKPTIALGVAALGIRALSLLSVPWSLVWPGSIVCLALSRRSGTRADKGQGVVQLLLTVATLSAACAQLVVPATNGFAPRPELAPVVGLAVWAMAMASAARGPAWWLVGVTSSVLLPALGFLAMQPRHVARPPTPSETGGQLGGDWPVCWVFHDPAGTVLPERVSATHSTYGWPRFDQGWPSSHGMGSICLVVAEADAPATGFPIEDTFGIWSPESSEVDFSLALHPESPTLWLRPAAGGFEVQHPDGRTERTDDTGLDALLTELYFIDDATQDQEPSRVRLQPDPEAPWTVQQAIDLCHRVRAAGPSCHLR